MYWEQNILKVHWTKTKYLPCNMHLPYWSSLRYSLVFCLFASGHRTFPIQSTWIGLPLYSKSIFFCSSFNKQGQWLAVVLQFTEKTVYKHKVAFNFKLKQSLYFKTIWTFIRSLPVFKSFSGHVFFSFREKQQLANWGLMDMK